MPDITISNLKQALIEVKRICQSQTECAGCPFDNEKKNFCPLQDLPQWWSIDDWEEEENANHLHG